MQSAINIYWLSQFWKQPVLLGSRLAEVAACSRLAARPIFLQPKSGFNSCWLYHLRGFTALFYIRMTNGKIKYAGAVIAKLRSRTSLYTCVDEIIIADVNYTTWLSVLWLWDILVCQFVKCWCNSNTRAQGILRWAKNTIYRTAKQTGKQYFLNEYSL